MKNDLINLNQDKQRHEINLNKQNESLNEQKKSLTGRVT